MPRSRPGSKPRRDRARRTHALFGDRLYIELQRHGVAAERIAEAALIELA